MKTKTSLQRLLCILLAAVTFVTVVPFGVTVSAASVNVNVPQNVKIGERYTGVKLYWSKDSSAKGYVVYRQMFLDDTWEEVYRTKSNSTTYYLDKDVIPDNMYYYKVQAYKTVGGQTYYSEDSAMKKAFYGLNPYIKLSGTSKIKAYWSPILYGAKGYYIYMSTNGGTFKKVKTLTDYKTKTCTISGLNTKKNVYTIQVRAYNVSSSGKKYTRVFPDYQGLYGGNIKFANYFKNCRSDSLETQINSTANTILPYSSFNVQGSEWVDTGVKQVTESDQEIFKTFESTYLSSNMSKYEKILHVFVYIHYTVDYAYDYSQVENLSNANAIFTEHKGQCLQYNGAMIAYMAYKGLEGSLLCGYRGYSASNRWQHFWGEIHLNGETYLIETGNEGKNGSWRYFFTPYAYTDGYMICGEVI